MNAENISAGPDTAPKKKSRLKKVFKVLAYSFLILFFSLLTFYLIYVSSGSTQWELKLDRDGVKVYSMKPRGTDVQQYKGVVHYEDTSLDDLVALIVLDDTLQNCKDWIPTCIGYERIEEWDPETMSNVNLWKFETPLGLPRSIVLLIDVDQDPETLEVVVDVLAVPSRLPYDDCCIRITDLHNTWHYTPTPDGGVDVVYRQNTSMGGLFPDFVVNFVGVEATYQLLHDKVPELLKDLRARDISYENIRALDEIDSGSAATDSASSPEP